MCQTCTVEERARVEVIEAIISLNHAAKRCVGVTRKFVAADPPENLTPWDRRHADIDALLYWLQVSSHILADCDDYAIQCETDEPEVSV